MAFPTFIKDENDIDFGQECPIFPPNCRYKVASVTINGRSITALLTEDEELLCFPQLVDYFLKDHVAGMPTIYAKVKRMGIIARSCNLDQVRLMRSMGAIGPVVNRCKLITMEDFKRLYEDCLLFRGPGRRKRVSSDAPSGTPIKIAIKRPYLEENDESDDQFYHGRKVEEEMIVNVSSPLSTDGSYFNEFDKSNGSDIGLTMRRPNGFSTPDDKLGFPSMIYSTFSSSPSHSAVTLSQTYDNRVTLLASPKTTLIQPINGEMSPALEDGNVDSSPVTTPTGEKSPQTSEPMMTEITQAVTTSTIPVQNSTNTHSNHVSSTDTTIIDHPKTTSTREVIRAPSTNVIFTHINGNSSGYIPRCSNRGAKPAGGTPLLAPRDIRQRQGLGLTSSETLIGNIQGLLKVTSDNVRMVERQMMIDKEEFAKEFQRECETRIKAEKMIAELQKDKSILQKKLRRSKKANRKLTNHCQVSEQRCLTLTNELQETSFGALRQQNEILQTELEKERLNRIDAEKKLEEARGGIQNFVHNFFENSEGNTGVLPAPM